MRDELLEELGDPSTAALTFDFESVISASYSFVDELIGEIVARMYPNAPRVINASPTVIDTIERSLRNRGLDHERILAASLEYA